MSTISYNIEELFILDLSPSQDTFWSHDNNTTSIAMPGIYSAVVYLIIFAWGSELKLESFKDSILDKIDVLVKGIVVEVKGRGKWVQEDGAAVKCQTPRQKK